MKDGRLGEVVAVAIVLHFVSFSYLTDLSIFVIIGTSLVLVGIEAALVVLLAFALLPRRRAFEFLDFVRGRLP